MREWRQDRATIKSIEYRTNTVMVKDALTVTDEATVTKASTVTDAVTDTNAVTAMDTTSHRRDHSRGRSTLGER